MHNFPCAEIPLLKALHTFPFLRFVRKHNLSVEELLSRANLPVDLMKSPDEYIPEARFWLFLDIAAHALSMEDDFGLQVGLSVREEDMGSFGERLAACPTIFSCLSAFCEMVVEESSDARFWAASSDDRLWFHRGGVSGINLGQKHAELYTLMFMIKVVQIQLGRFWVPKLIHLQTESPVAKFRTLDVFRSSRVKYHQGSTSIAISLADARLSGGSALEFLFYSSELKIGFLDKLRKALSLYQMRSSLTLTEIADIIGMSSRTLQRRLKDRGISFKQLQEQMKLEVCLELMKDRSSKLTDIAAELGYSDSAHFTRAFQRWTGMAPSRYRIDVLGARQSSGAVV